MTQQIEQELIGLENKFWQAIQDKDVEAALELAYNPCIVAGSSGIGKIDKATFTKMMEGANYTLEKFEIKGAKVLQLADDVAVLAYEVHEELTVDGKPVSMDASDASTWVKRDGKWVCAMHTECVFGDPYGRDRKSALKPSGEDGKKENEGKKIHRQT